MAIHSIDYLNARKAAKHSTNGGRIYTRTINPVDVRARDAEMDAVEMLHEQVRGVFKEFRAWFNESTNQLHTGNLMESDHVPF